MKKKNLPTIALTLVSFFINFTSAFSCPISEQEVSARLSVMDFADDQSSISSQTQSNLTQDDFNSLINSVVSAYEPIFIKKGLKLKIKDNWRNDEPNAYSGVSGNTHLIFLYGGYARHPLMTKDAYLSVICHEVGHHLGGYPRLTDDVWSSAEGEADYFSTLKCMKVVLKNNLENEQIARSLDLPLEIKNQCRTQYLNDDDYYICLRSSKASETYGKVNASLADPDHKNEISLLTPDLRRVRMTNLSYPDPQCRVDTKLQGALCSASVEVSLGNADENKGACSEANGNVVGLRPHCWYKN